jgi:hypothetical protein
MNAAGGLDRVALLLQKALNGDASTINELRGVSQAALKAAGEQLGGRLSFGRPTVLRVLMDWRAGRVTEEQVRSWALLMFIGGFPDTRSRVSWSVHFTSQPIDVDYSDDDVVNDIVFELKDLGEPVDGIITPAQRNEIIERLESSP